MIKKILYFDTETTGLDPVQNDIIQLAGMVVIGKEVKAEFNLKMRPFKPENASVEALAVSGNTLEGVMEFPDPTEVYGNFITILSQYVDRYDKNDKFTPAGYNVRFDMDMLRQFFIKNGDQYFGSWLNWKCIDPFPVLHFLDFAGKISLDNYKLSTVCEHYGIEINAHDALSDIKATRELLNKLYSTYFCQPKATPAMTDGEADLIIKYATIGKMFADGKLVINELLTMETPHKIAKDMIEQIKTMEVVNETN